MKWLANPRMVLLLVLCIPVREVIIVPMIKAAAEINQPLNIVETCIAVTDYDKLNDGASGFHMRQVLPPNLFYQMAPYKAFFLSFLLLALFILLCSMFMMLGAVYSRKMLFFVLLCIQLVAGYALCELERFFMWFLPFRHMVLSMHYHVYLREYVFPPWGSITVFSVLLMIEMIVGCHKAKKVSLDMIGGDVLS